MVLVAFLAGCAAGCGLMAYGSTGTWWGLAAGAWGFAAGVEFAAAWWGAQEEGEATVGDYIGRYVIVRSRDQGVVCGVLRTLTPQPGGLPCAELAEASQIHNWHDGKTITLFETALNGFGTATISQQLDRVLVFGVCGVLLCTEKAEANLRQPRTRESAPSSGSTPAAAKRRG